MGDKVVFTNCAFEKLRSSGSTIFIVFSANHSSCNKKGCMLKNRTFMKNSGLFLNMAKGDFFFFGF